MKAAAAYYLTMAESCRAEALASALRATALGNDPLERSADKRRSDESFYLDMADKARKRAESYEVLAQRYA